MLLVSLKSLGRKEEPLIGEKSRSDKIRKKVTTKAMTVLSALTEEHGRPHLDPTS